VARLPRLRPRTSEDNVSRPRIRTIKPETWDDEKIGRVSRDARLLFVGLITMADDEGRFRSLPAQVLGHVYPYDTDAPKKLERWMCELVDVGLVVVYERDGVQYGAIPNFTKHQRISHPKDSLIPTPPSSNGHARAVSA
jgi:hypothetical protein